jgi:DNA-binding MarR family transcriptional regulator
VKEVKVKVDYEKSVGPWLGKTVKILDYYLQEALQNNGLDLSKEQMLVLKKLHENDGLNQNDLALLTWRNKSSLTRLLSKMEKKHYIRRVQSHEDKRNNHVYLTPLGRDIFQRTQPVIRNLLMTMERNITDVEIEQMINTLKKIQANFNVKAEIKNI